MISPLDIVEQLARIPLEGLMDPNLYCLIRHARHYLGEVCPEESYEEPSTPQEPFTPQEPSTSQEPSTPQEHA